MTSSVVLVSSPTAAIETSLAVEADPMPLNLSGAIDAATIGLGCGAMAAPGTCCLDSGGPLIVDPPLWNYLILLCKGTSAPSDDTSVSLSMI
jgi:hypothetical protein